MVTVDEEREDAFRKTTAGQMKFGMRKLPRRVDPEVLLPVRFVKPMLCDVCGENPPAGDRSICARCIHRGGHRAGCGCPFDPGAPASEDA